MLRFVSPTRRGPKPPATKDLVPRDDLEQDIAEETARDPDFPKFMDAAEDRDRIVAALAGARRAAGLTQTQVAAKMETSASVIARLEAGDVNPTMATLQSFAIAVGKRLDVRLLKG